MLTSAARGKNNSRTPGRGSGFRETTRVDKKVRMRMMRVEKMTMHKIRPVPVKVSMPVNFQAMAVLCQMSNGENLPL